MNLTKFLLENWVLILAALTSGGLLLWPTLSRSGGGGSVGTSEAVRLINREKAVLIDVSEPDEFARGHAAGARNVPLNSLQGAKELPSNKQLPVVLMCSSGARAARAAGELRKLGHERATALAGGLKAWRDANLPLEKSAAA
ncbi:MAG TPA: rhodanese-like domain-containing protein [Burkholderiaceae bacterium]|jgi:rhodanese-related sulfurtransferase|nr:rhodanese-like domain-containing protein [Burkholderiaceae bacterium]HYJ98200.1 rhodanese-like domain-containing protein [Burkholderiaceae bacterium]